MKKYMFKLLAGMIYQVSILLILSGWSQVVLSQAPPKAYTKVTLLMGSRFEIVAISSDSAKAMQAIDKGFEEISRIEKLISSWIPESQTSEINQMAGVNPVKVSDELYALIFRSLKVSALTNGAYDISFAGMEPIWQFDKTVLQDFPDSSTVARASEKISFKHIILDDIEKTVFLSRSGMNIGFGSIGKGYAANSAMAVMKAHGSTSGMVNAGGDLITWGLNQDGKQWSIGIADPDHKNQILGWLSLKDMSLVTSGDYEKYFVYENERYGHIIDPRTGYPAKGIKSVSVLCPDAELADALATSIYVLGEKEGIALCDQLKGVECLIITQDSRMVQSKSLTLQYYVKKN